MSATAIRTKRLDERTRPPFEEYVPKVPLMHDRLRALLDSATRRYGWNRRIFSQVDFELICDREGVYILDLDVDAFGLYTTLDGSRVIIINPRLHKRSRRWVQMHELGHHLCGHPATPAQFRSSAPDAKARYELEADLFAAVALIPAFLLARHSIRQIQRLYPVCAELCASRLRIQSALGI